MKNQPNKTTVKDGLPTAHNALSDAYQRHGWLFQPDVLPSGACPHERIAMEAMQSYSDQQNAELRERVKELEEAMNRIMEISITDTGRILSQSYGIAKEALKQEVNND